MATELEAIDRYGVPVAEPVRLVASGSRESRFENALFRLGRWIVAATRWLGGVLGIGFILAWLATVPIIQFVTLGFFVEVAARIIRTGKLRHGFVGVSQGWSLFKVMLGVGITWLPLLAVSRMRYDAWLIDPAGAAANGWRTAEYIVLGLTILHWIGVGLTGGRLRHFIWPLLVPWYLATGLLKRVLRWSWCRWALERTVGSWFPRTLAAYYQSRRWSDWFVPAVLWRHVKQGTLLTAASDRFWTWVGSVRPWYYGGRGIAAFGGLFIWFVGPTLWLLIATRSANTAGEVIFFLLGLLHLFLSLQYFPLVHCLYCETGRWRSYWQWRVAARRFGCSPFRFCLAATLTAILTFPLWLTRIAMIPYDLWWLLALIYVLLLWPTWMVWGWAWHQAAKRAAQDRKTSWFWRWSWTPVFWALIIVQLFVTTLSIYTSWDGVFNILLHPTFNLPTPFSPTSM